MSSPSRATDWPSNRPRSARTRHRYASAFGARRATFLVPAVLVLLMRSPVALALAFAPTEAEWYHWPDYCQARYTVSGAGTDSQFANRVDPATVKSWEAKLGPDVWYALHHYCAGMIIATRAKAEPDKKERLALFNRAIDEDQFTLQRMPQAHPMRAEIAARMGLLYAEIGQPDLALQHFDIAIDGCPSCGVGYEAKSMYLKSHGQLEAARDVLVAGDKAVDGSSAQIHYFLGLVLLELKDFDAASEQARKAYGQGYPLPGLRDLLAKAGHPLASP